MKPQFVSRLAALLLLGLFGLAGCAGLEMEAPALETEMRCEEGTPPSGKKPDAAAQPAAPLSALA